MGGYGSGRWAWHTRKTTVEESLILDMNSLARFVDLKSKDGFIQSATLTWSNSVTREVTSRINYQVSTLNKQNPLIRLYYTRTNTKEDIDYKVRLTATKQNFGGRRWWFVCPLVVNNRACNRRVGKLYLPSGGKYFGCRHCYDLTYESCLESRQFDGLWKKLAKDLPEFTPQEVKQIMRGKW